MGQGVATIIRLVGIMITAVHILTARMIHAAIIHVVVLAMTRILGIMHIAGNSRQRLRCKQYKYGQ